MNSSYENALQSLNDAELELKNRNDKTLYTCIKYIKNAIVEIGRLNAQYANLSAQYDVSQFMQSMLSEDDADCWSDD
jgi:hypothetical protein